MKEIIGWTLCKVHADYRTHGLYETYNDAHYAHIGRRNGKTEKIVAVCDDGYCYEAVFGYDDEVVNLRPLPLFGSIGNGAVKFDGVK
ncbi:hypothetical protein QB910_000136 [Dabrowskivirus KKP3916]|uniref:Uncharacterized protein n=1 Tax=Alicyclobacillus phage KKP_3916 TaxID=3040651 RepID=A0AAT9V7R8_9CAUD|nr:hypothetical protein QB910_000136 [Alicyclobacillus phage KKP 3916]